MKKLLLGLLVSILLITGCTSVTKTGALGIDRQQLMLVSYEKMDKISAEAYVKALKEAKDKGKLNIDPILTKRVSRNLQGNCCAGRQNVEISSCNVKNYF